MHGGGQTSVFFAFISVVISCRYGKAFFAEGCTAEYCNDPSVE
jgi:hypothetical protein